MNDGYLNEKQYVNLIGGIAILHDCQLVDIDFSEQTIRFTGPPKKVGAYAAELNTLLGRGEH